jgi:hypothetical protein
MVDLTKHEIEALEMLAGRREEKRGAMVSMCLDYLRRHGYCTPGPNYAITSAGLAVLAERDRGGAPRRDETRKAKCIPMTARSTLLSRCVAVRAVLREDEAEAAARQAIGAPLEGYAASIQAWRWHLRSIQWQLVHLRLGRERAAKRA